jgi:hypothetical protein
MVPCVSLKSDDATTNDALCGVSYLLDMSYAMEAYPLPCFRVAGKNVRAMLAPQLHFAGPKSQICPDQILTNVPQNTISRLIAQMASPPGTMCSYGGNANSAGALPICMQSRA